jgi:hypothetical protein
MRRTGIACCTSRGTITTAMKFCSLPDEVTHARENACTALFVVANFDVERADDGAAQMPLGLPRARVGVRRT